MFRMIYHILGMVENWLIFRHFLLRCRVLCKGESFRNDEKKSDRQKRLRHSYSKSLPVLYALQNSRCSSNRSYPSPIYWALYNTSPEANSYLKGGIRACSVEVDKEVMCCFIFSSSANVVQVQR